MALKNTSTGRRREQVSIYKMDTIRDAGGGNTSNPVLYWQTMADVEQVKAARVAQSFQDKLKTVMSVRLRYRSDKILDGSMIVKVEGSDMAIHSIDTDTYRRKFIELIVVK